MDTDNDSLSLSTPTRRGLLGAIPAIAVALAVTGSPAQAGPALRGQVRKTADAPECLADLGVL